MDATSILTKYQAWPDIIMLQLEQHVIICCHVLVYTKLSSACPLGFCLQLHVLLFIKEIQTKSISLPHTHKRAHHTVGLWC